jgi:catechol 2,3-dioxygenase-like lactoylglutathione lyase family enzyme
MNVHPATRARRIIARIAFLALATTVYTFQAPALTSPDAPPPFNGIAHIAIRVHDLAASTAFYQELGFEQPFSLDHEGQISEAFVKINDSQFIELYPTSEKNPDTGFLHLCFDGIDLNAIHDDYIGRGLTPKPVRTAGAGNLLFTMAGPQQPFGPQNIEYTQYQPGSRHYEDRGKHLGADRVATKLITVTLAMENPSAARDFYINQLGFKPLPGDPMTLHLPGDSGQQVEIVPATPLGNKARIILQAESLSKASRILHKQHIAFTKANNTLTLTDPDGNIILIESR